MPQKNVLRTLFADHSARKPWQPLVTPPVVYPPWLKVVSYVALINFAVFIIMAAWLRGSALGGHVTDGHYFLMWHGGDYTEVSQDVFRVSLIHGRSMVATHIVALLCWAGHGLAQKFKRRA